MSIEIKEGVQPVDMNEEVNRWFCCSNCGTRQAIKKIENYGFACKKCNARFERNEAGEWIGPKTKKITIEEEHIFVFNCPRCLERQAQGTNAEGAFFIECNRCGIAIQKIGDKWFGIQKDDHTGEFVTPLPGEWHGKLR